MNIAFGHTNMDLDCLGSLILIKKLFPDYRLVRSKLIHPVAQNLYYFYEKYFDFLLPKDLEDQQIDNIIIVDTCLAGRVKEYFGYIHDTNFNICIFDHHHLENCDILGAQVEEAKVGANTSYLGKLVMERGITLLPEEATIALTGIYADTGRFIYENVCRIDFEVSAWLLEMGASLKLVKSFLETIKEDEQIVALNQILFVLETKIIQGHVILFSYLELDEQISGLAAVIDKVMDIENPDAYFAIFSFPKTRTVQLIARSKKAKIDLHELLHVYGGGGHQMAAAAKIVNKDGSAFKEELCAYLEKSLEPATRAKDIMNTKVLTINESMSLLDASLFLETVEYTGVPVVNDQKEVTGFMSLRNIMNGRRAGHMQAPVTAYMSKPAITSNSMVTLREIEKLFYKHHIDHLPIVEDKKLLGIVTRWNYLEYKEKQQINRI